MTANNANMDEAEQIVNNWTRIAGSTFNRKSLYRNPKSDGPKFAQVEDQGHFDYELVGYVGDVNINPLVPTANELAAEISFHIDIKAAQTLVDEWTEWAYLTLDAELGVDDCLYRERENRIVYEIMDRTFWLDGIRDVLGDELDREADLEMGDGEVFENVKNALVEEVWSVMQYGYTQNRAADLAAEIEFVEYGQITDDDG